MVDNNEDEGLGFETARDRVGKTNLKAPLDVIPEGIPYDLPKSQMEIIRDKINDVHSVVGDLVRIHKPAELAKEDV